MAETVAYTIDAEEQEMILRCQRGDRSAFAPLVMRYMRRAAAFALAWTGNQEDALDLSQEAFVRAYRAIERFDPDRPFYPWFHRILKNLCLNHLGRASRLHEVPIMDHVDWADAHAGPDVLLEREELKEQVWQGIRKLNAHNREILILREFQHLTYAEIAEVLDIPRGTVMSRLHQARSHLKTKLEPFMTGKPGRGVTS